MVIISQRVVTFPERDEISDSLDQKLTNFLSSLGVLCIPLPNTLKKNGILEAWLKKIQPNGIILSGGNDLGEYPDRDETENKLISYARERSIPILGICRGMQILATYFGVKLVPVQGHVKSRHNLVGEIAGEVNSYHRFSIQSCPQNFSVLARTQDGEIEAIRHLTLPWEGWMWHPEREDNIRTQDLMRIKELFLES